jgi:prolyl oligopeptidase
VIELRYPKTRMVDQTDVLHGEALSDLYRWLEDSDTPEVVAWTARQNALTESSLAAVPGRTRIRDRLDALLAIGAISVPTPTHGRYF